MTLPLAAGIPFHPPTNASAIVDIVLRWIHFVAGITWVGLLYFFNLVNVPFMRQANAQTKSVVIPKMIAPAMWWFRWGGLLTVLAGIFYWMKIGGTDAHNGGTNPGFLFTSFFVIWVVAFVLQMGMLMGGLGGGIIAVGETILMIAAALTFLGLNNHEWESNRTLSIGIGGGLGLVMLLNVWGLIWRANKKVIRWTEQNGASGAALPDDLARFSRKGYLASRVNFALSFPMLFFMATSSHYPMFGR